MKMVIDTEHPQGYLVAMTPEEEAQFQADQAGAAQSAEAAAATAANVETMRSQLAGRLNQVRLARQALAGGQIFSGLSSKEKAVIDGLLEDNIYLARLTLRLYEGVT